MHLLTSSATTTIKVHLKRCVAVTSLLSCADIVRIIAKTQKVFCTIVWARYTIFLHSPTYRLPSKDISLLHRINCNSHGYYLRLLTRPCRSTKYNIYFFVLYPSYLEQSPIIKYSATLNITEYCHTFTAFLGGTSCHSLYSHSLYFARLSICQCA